MSCDHHPASCTSVRGMVMAEFYDEIAEPSARRRAELALPFTEQDRLRRSETRSVGGMRSCGSGSAGETSDPGGRRRCQV
jgi:hypothetical protein